MDKVFIGVDGGGTKTKIQIEDALGNVLATARSGPANIKTSVSEAWHSIQEGIAEAAKFAQLNLADYEVHVGLGLAGVEIDAAKTQFLSQPHPYASLVLDSDAYVACLGVHEGADGAIIIIGTGVNGYMVEAQQRYQVSGWGFPHGDEGGGAWLGMEAIRLTLKSLDGRLKPTPMLDAIYKHFGADLSRLVSWANQAAPQHFGQIAPFVVEFALTDPHAEALLNLAAREIDSIAWVLQQRSKHSKLPIGLLGGVAAFIEPRLSQEVKAAIVSRKFDATKGAVLMIRQKVLGQW